MCRKMASLTWLRQYISNVVIALSVFFKRCAYIFTCTYVYMSEGTHSLLPSSMFINNTF